MGIEVSSLIKEEKSKDKQSEIDSLNIWVDAFGYISNHHLLIMGWAFHPNLENPSFNLCFLDNKQRKKGKSENFSAEVVRSTRLDVNKHFSYEGSGRWGFALIVDWPHEELPEEGMLQLYIEAGKIRKNYSLKSFSELSGKDIFFFSSSWKNEEKTEFISKIYEKLGRSLYETSDFVQLPEQQLRSRVNWNWEIVLVIPGQGVLLSGWLTDVQQNLISMVLRTSDGSYSKNLLERSVRYPREDVLKAFPGAVAPDYKAGLYSWIPIPQLSEQVGLELVMLTQESNVTSIPLKKEIVRKDIISDSQKILANFDISDRNYRQVMEAHIGAALSALWKHRQATLSKPEVEVLQFGPKVESPKRSVIVPIYGRYDFLLHQIAQFVSDSDFSETDLIYVLDDPRIYNEFIPFCRDTSELFPASFRVIYCGRNLGYAGANNLGVRYVNAEKLVLLNSDIIPDQPGWISRIEEKKSKLDNVGVVAPKLVYEDNTIQHVGMDFIKVPELGSLWMNDHPGKGSPEWLLNVPTVSEHPAVTGACMFIDKSLYEEVGGFDENYIFGDFEDSDLCLKLQQKGYRHYVLADEKLYHLERQSQNLFDNRDWKFKITLYNAWLHTSRWGSLIEQLQA